MSKTLLFLAIGVLVFQVVIFFVIRSQRKKVDHKSFGFGKYVIHSRADAWRLLNDPSIPEKDRIRIEEIYNRI